MRAATLPTLIAAILVVAACGGDDDAATPTACLSPAAEYLEALDEAPGDVRVGGTTPISACLVRGQSGGPLAQAGESMVIAATRLNQQIRRSYDREATIQLGYLVGAVQEGAVTTGGIHEDLVLRLDDAARHTGDGESFGARFERDFGEGYAAGQQRG